jgi:hypothetical protein
MKENFWIGPANLVVFELRRRGVDIAVADNGKGITKTADCSVDVELQLKL